MKSKYKSKSDLKNLIELYLILFPAVFTRELIMLRKQSRMKFDIMFFKAQFIKYKIPISQRISQTPGFESLLLSNLI